MKWGMERDGAGTMWWGVDGDKMYNTMTKVWLLLVLEFGICCWGWVACLLLFCAWRTDLYEVVFKIKEIKMLLFIFSLEGVSSGSDGIVNGSNLERMVTYGNARGNKCCLGGEWWVGIRGWSALKWLGEKITNNGDILIVVIARKLI